MRRLWMLVCLAMAGFVGGPATARAAGHHTHHHRAGRRLTSSAIITVTAIITTVTTIITVTAIITAVDRSPAHPRRAHTRSQRPPRSPTWCGF